MGAGADTDAAGGDARRLAIGSVVQQVSQVAGLLAMFLVLTILARRLSLSELGVYGLLSSLAGYLLVLQNAVAVASLKYLSAAPDGHERSRAFSTAAVLYIGAGLATGLMIAAVGWVLAGQIDISEPLERQARGGAALLGLIMAIGYPITVFRDALRAEGLFTRAASMEIVGLCVYAATILGLIFVGAPLWILIGVSGTIPLLAGTFCLISVLAMRLPYRFSPGAFDRRLARQFLGLSGYLGIAEVAAVVIYALDRVILGIFYSAATVGLYEGPVRVHNLIRALNGALTVTVLPTASGYVARGDEARLHELVVRGSRYTLAIVVPVTLTVMILGGPILDVWLGDEFREGQTALAILVSYWLFNASLGVLNPLLVAVGRARTIARYAWTAAIMNLVLALSLTPWLGLEGVALAIAIPYVVLFPFLLRLTLSAVPVTLGDLVRESWIPAFSVGAVLAAALGAARLTLPLDDPLSVAAVGAAGPLLFGLLYYAFVLSPGERTLVRGVARSFVPLGPRG